jgi:hypothetical protein
MALYDPQLSKQITEELRGSVQPKPDPVPAQAVAVAKPAERVLAQYRATGHASQQARLFRGEGYAEVMPYHLLNLARLAEHLRKLPEDYAHFEMKSYQGGGATVLWRLMGPLGRTGELVPGMCGTTACAVGHAPNAGMGVRRPLENWAQYEARLFTSAFHKACFSGNWASVDNTVRGAAARILYVLDHPGSLFFIRSNTSGVTGRYAEYEA